MISSIILLIRYKKIKHIEIYFFVIGIITNFFDFLTVPIVTLAIPLIIYLLLIEEKKLTIKEKLIKIIKCSIIWGISYGLTWLSKWILIDLIFKKNMISTALQQVKYRSIETNGFGFVNVLMENLSYIKLTLKSYISIFIIILIVININLIKNPELISKNIKLDYKKIIEDLLPFFIISYMPIIWYFVLQNHSYYHAFFTYRNLIILIICIGIEIKKLFKYSVL